MIIRAGKSKICKAGDRLGIPSGVDTAVLKKNFFFSGKSHVLVLDL